MINTLIAPNGKPSNLNAEQYALVRTPAFKKWFGDWENDPQNASKVVDENGEPLVVYHGAEIFNKNEKGLFYIFRAGSYFTDTYKSAEYYAYKLAYGITDVKKEDTEIYSVFLNIKNPKTFDYTKDDAEDYFHDFDQYDERIDTYLSEGYDGIFWEYTFKMYETSIKNKEKHFISFNPNQVKLADGSNTKFDASSPDIRYADGGAAGEEITCVNCGWHWNTSDSDESDKYVCHKCGFDNKLFYDPRLMGIMADATLLNLKKNGILLRDKENKITLIAYNTGNQKRGAALYNTALIYKSVKPIRQANEIIEMLYNQEYEQFDVSKIEEYKKSNRLIIMNQNEVVYDSEKTDLTYAYGGTAGITKIAEDVYISRNKNKLPKDATIVMHRYNDNIKSGELGLFAGNLEDMELDNGYGENKAYISIGKNAKLKKIISTERYLTEIGEFDKSRKYLQEKYGYDSLLDLMDDAGSLDNPSNAWYERQKVALNIMREAGEDFEVLEMLYEEDYIPHQYLITTVKNKDISFADGGEVDFGEVLFGEDEDVRALQPKGIEKREPNTEYENELQKAIYEHTMSSLNKEQIIKNKSLLESARNQFPELLRPKISPFDENFLFRGVSFSEDSKENIIKMLGLSIENPLGDEPIQFSYENSSEKFSRSSVIYGKYYQKADFGIKDFKFTSWTTDYNIANRFNGSKGFVYAVSFERSDDLYLRPKLSNAISSYKENEILFYNEGRGISTNKADKDSFEVKYIYILYSADNLARLFDTDIYTIRNNINARPISSGSTSEIALQHDLNILNSAKLAEDWFKKGGLSKTPAPKKERVFGSDKNKVGSAASDKSAKEIRLDDSIVTTLQNKAKEYNKENSGNKVTLNTLKAVMRRGMGAYSTSHRPTITGGAPNSRQAWGFARVNKFLKKKSGEKVKKAYIQDDDLLADGGLTHKNNLKMTQHNYQSMKPIGEIQVGDIYLIKEDMFAPHQDHEHPQHLSTRYATVEVKSPCHKGLDAYVLEVMECDCDHAAGKYAKGKIIERSRKHILSSGKLKSAVAKPTEFKDGGELNADSQEVKEYFAHDSGNAGGLLVGKRHSEGGIKADVKSTGQRIEMEGGEAVITRGAVNSKKKYVYEGKEMTTREILSDLNVKGGGVAFADGGDVPEKINCGCSSMKVGGISYTPQDFITFSEKEYQEHRLIDGIEKERNDHFYTLAKLNSGAISIEQALREIASKEMMIDPKYPYSE